MFKSNLSPLNPSKDKYCNNNYNQSNNDFHQQQNYHQSSYQYAKSIYNNNGVSYQKQESNQMGNNNYQNNNYGASNNYVSPLSPHSPNISKNPPMSPTAKIKMFSNTLNLNKKNSNNTNLYQASQTQIVIQNPKQNKAFNRMGVKNLVLDLTESLDLKCDQVFDEGDFSKNNYRKQTPQTCNININRQYTYNKKVPSKIPVLNFQAQLDDLKCDQVLDIKAQMHHQDIKSRVKTTNPITNNLENNSTYLNNKNNPIIDKLNFQGPLTPNNQKKKSSTLITRKYTDRDYQPNNTSNPSLNNIPEKPRSFTHILSPNTINKHSQQNNQEDLEKSPTNSSPISASEFSTNQKTFQQMKKYLERTTLLLQAYKKRLDDVEQKNVFLQKENSQLRKCLYEEGGNRGNSANQGHQMTSAGRYQGVK